MKTLTVVQAKHLADKADTLFEKAARAWERGNNSGNSERLAIEEQRCGFDYYDCLGAISAALEPATSPH